MRQHLIDIRTLKKYYPVRGGVFKRHIADVKAVDGVDLKIEKGECLGLVGESGCGKTTLGKTLLRLHDATEGRIYYDQPAQQIEEVENDIRFGNPVAARRAEEALKTMDLTRLNGRRLKAMRQKVQIVFQDPSSSLDPRMLVKNIIAEPLVTQRLLKSYQVEDRVQELLYIVGMGKEHMRRYPHEFSGGQRQRIAIARALASKPEFILMDEPTSALDVSVQSQILNLLKDLQAKFNLTYMFVTHHLLVVKYISNRIAVMYLGQIVELSKTSDFFEKPLHPYTKALLSAIPIPEPEMKRERIILTGDVPNPINPPTGCRFHPRCMYVKQVCREVEPELEEASEGHLISCHRWRDI
jgi:oligopeptide/dipeptide ABC transporter ATP-binding protein